MARQPDVEETLTTFDGLELHVERFVPGSVERSVGDSVSPATPRAAVVMIHGFSAHCGAFRHVADAIARAGFAVTAFDCRGHGRSPGRHGYVRRFTDYGDDLGRVIAHARRVSPGLPLAVAAHSHGVTVTLDYLFRGGASFDALVAAAPYLALKMPVPLYKRAIAPLLSMLWPTLAMSNQIEPGLTSRNPEACAGMAADPLVRHVATPRWFHEVGATQARLRASASLLKVPTFMPVAGADRLVDPSASLAFAKDAGPIVELKVYEDLFHELYLEPERDVVIADVVAWLTGRFRGTSERDPYT
ncbi:MAG: hydrolase [Myxococcales bacterium]|nr:hydrolase [Myxococcales bacterium]